MSILKSIISIFLSLFCLITGHTVVIDPAVPPTCESVGYSEGSHCERCGKILVFQEEIPVKHNFVNYKCTLCGDVDKSHPYEVLLAFVYENGEVDGECVFVEYYSDSGTRYSLTYWPETDSLQLTSYYRDNASGIIFFSGTTIDPSNTTMDMIFRYGTDGQTIVQGHANKSTFTTRTPVIVDYYNGPNQYYYDDVEAMRQIQVGLLGFFEWYLDSYNVGLTLSDLGYDQFIYE